MTVPPRKDLGSVPPLFPDHATSEPRRRAVAVWMLGAALICQLFLVLVGSIAIGLGGAGGIGGVALRADRARRSRAPALEVAILRGRVQARFAWAALAVLLLDVVFVMLLAAGGLAGHCSEAELAISNEIPSYGGLGGAFEHESSTGACAAHLEVEASANEALLTTSARSAKNGLDRGRSRDPHGGTGGRTSPAPELTASRGGALFTIALESYSGRASAAIRVEA